MTPATIIDERFVLDAEHKRGGMGAVWKATDLRTRQPVAVKVLHAHSAGDHAQRFVREARLLAELAHGSLVAYIAHGNTADGAPYLVMEWLDGETLGERLARQPLTLSDSLTLVRASTRALCVAHERGLVHRDLKPSNLFLRNRRLDDVVLLDLGIARLSSSDDGLTRTGTILGTPSYMAPEQAQGLSDVGPAADVFSLGCVLFECLVGRPPFVGDHVLSVLAKVLFEQAPRLRQLRPELPPDVEALLEQMLQKDRARRPADAAAIRHALAHLHDVEPTLVVPAPSSASTRPSAAEQQLVSVILATRHDPVSAPASLELSSFGGELKYLADGTAVVTLAHRRGAATDLAVRAARCALRLRDSTPGWSLVLATGRAVPLEHVHIGEAVDRAAQLLRARGERQDDAIWLDETTAGLLDARFRLTPIGGGLVALEGEEPTVDPARPLLGLPTACVGREHELATLELSWRACIEESSPRALLIVAPAGMGKTRLRHELVRRLESAGGELSVFDGLGDPIRSSSRFGLLGSALARLCGLRVEDPPAAQRARLEARVGQHLAPSERLRTAAFLGELCGVPYPAGALPELDSAQRIPQQMARLIEHAWLTFLRAESAARPVLFVLDNLHWSDALSLELMGTALRELRSSPLLVLGLARPEVNELFPELWAQRLAKLPLRPLSSAAMTRLVRQVLAARIGNDELQRLVARADGNALYLEELIRAAASGRDAVPETVLAMLQARITLLEAGMRRVLRAASVFGESVPAPGVVALLQGTLSEAEVARALEALVEQEILEPSGYTGARRPWRFRHVLMRDAAYGLFTSQDRTLSHLLAARYLVDAREDSAVVAAHFELAGQPAEAVRHYLIAAELAYRRADHAAIQSLVSRALAAGAVGVERGIARSIEAPSLLFRHDFAGCWAAAEESLALLPPGHQRRTQSLGTATFCGVQMGRWQEVGQLVEELYATEPDERDRAEYTMSVGYACLSNVVLGNRRACLRLLARIGNIDAQLGGDDLIARGSVLFCRAFFLQFLGDSPYEAWSLAQHSSAQQRAIGNRRLLSNSLVLLGEAARWLFSVDEGLRAMRQAVHTARETSETVVLDYLSQFLVILLAEHGRPEELDEARELAALPLRRSTSGGLYRALGLAGQALLQLRQADLTAAAALAREARSLVRRLGHRAFWPHTDRVLLEVLLRTGEHGIAALAEEALADAAVWGPIGHLELPLRFSAARAQLSVGRREEGLRTVRAALATLQARAAKIPTAALREGFLSAVPEHAALRALASDLGVGPGELAV